MAYSDKKKAVTLVRLATNEGNISKTAREMEIDRDTVYRWIEEGVEGENIAEYLQIVLLHVLSQVPDFSKPGAANSWPAAVRELVSAIQLLTGGATQRTESRNASIELLPPGMTKAEYQQALENMVGEVIPEVGPKLPKDLSQDEYNKVLEEVLTEIREEGK